MEIKIGVRDVSREIVFDTDLTTEQLTEAVTAALQGTVLELPQAKGGRVMVPTAAIGYIEFGSEEKRRVGFGV